MRYLKPLSVAFWQFFAFVLTIFILRAAFGRQAEWNMDWVLTGCYGLLVFSGLVITAARKKLQLALCMLSAFACWFFSSIVSYFDQNYIFQDPFLWLGVLTVYFYSQPCSKKHMFSIGMAYPALIIISSSIALAKFGPHAPTNGAYQPFNIFQNVVFIGFILYSSGTAMLDSGDGGPADETRKPEVEQNNDFEEYKQAA